MRMSMIYSSPQTTAALNRTYDFITCTETVEHFTDPCTELQRFDILLRPGGWLGVMTGMLDSWDDFPSWYYHPRPNACEFLQPRDDALGCGVARLGRPLPA